MATFDQRQQLEFVVRVSLSAILLVAGLIVILFGDYSDATNKWAYGVIGIVVGYWLR